MATPIVRKSTNHPSRLGQQRLQPLLIRRCAAWAVEVSLVIASAVVPLAMGAYVKSTSTMRVPLNPVLAVTEQAIARTLDLPVRDSKRNVAPLTNLFWSAAIVAPIVLTGWQLCLLAKTGSTSPKRWLGVRVVTATGNLPSVTRLLVREGVGRWGLPLLIAYLLWRYSRTFPNLAILAGLTGFIMLGESIGYRFQRRRRALHDLLAGTYVVDVTRTTLTPFLSSNGESLDQPSRRETSYRWTDGDEDAAIAALVLTPENKQQSSVWSWMRHHPRLTLLLVALFNVAAVLGSLVSTQIYVQTQANQRSLQQQQSQQFLALVKQLDPKSPATLAERRSAVLALGTLDDQQAAEFLVSLLEETGDGLLDVVQQSLVNAGPRVIPYLQRLNQSLSNQMESRRYDLTPDRQELRVKRLQATQRAIAKILVVYSGKAHALDLSRTDLGHVASPASFALVLDKIDLSGILFRAANLNQASFRGSRFHGPGEDGQWNTYDDWIADLSGSQLKQADFTSANLSHVLINHSNLMRAILNQANLSGASLRGTNLSDTQLVSANLRGADLENASLTGSDLGEADFQGANLYAARLSRVSAVSTRFSFASMIQSDWQGADLSGADLSHANLRHADLSATRLTGTSFRNAQLENANLRNADLGLADLRGANLAGADFQGAIFVSLKPAQPDQFIQTPTSNTQSALVEGVDFAKAKNLDVRQLAYICTQGGHHPRCP